FQMQRYPASQSTPAPEPPLPLSALPQLLPRCTASTRKPPPTRNPATPSKWTFFILRTTPYWTRIPAIVLCPNPQPDLNSALLPGCRLRNRLLGHRRHNLVPCVVRMQPVLRQLLL